MSAEGSLPLDVMYHNVMPSAPSRARKHPLGDYQQLGGWIRLFLTCRYWWNVLYPDWCRKYGNHIDVTRTKNPATVNIIDKLRWIRYEIWSGTEPYHPSLYFALGKFFFYHQARDEYLKTRLLNKKALLSSDNLKPLNTEVILEAIPRIVLANMRLMATSEAYKDWYTQHVDAYERIIRKLEQPHSTNYTIFLIRDAHWRSTVWWVSIIFDDHIVGQGCPNTWIYTLKSCTTFSFNLLPDFFVINKDDRITEDNACSINAEATSPSHCNWEYVLKLDKLVPIVKKSPQLFAHCYHHLIGTREMANINATKDDLVTFFATLYSEMVKNGALRFLRSHLWSDESNTATDRRQTVQYLSESLSAIQRCIKHIEQVTGLKPRDVNANDNEQPSSPLPSVKRPKNGPPSVSVTITVLPVELLFIILGMLPVEDIKNTSSVNKCWWSVIGDKDFWKQVYHRYFGGPIAVEQQSVVATTTLPSPPPDWLSIFKKTFKEYRQSDRTDNPLYWAIQNHHISLVKHLVLTQKVSIGVNFIGKHALFGAAQCGASEIVAFLLKCGANVNATASNSATSLYVACQNGHTEVVKLLLSSGANIETPFGQSYTPLYIAAQNGHFEVLKLLIKAGANLEAHCSDGSTALYIASQRGWLDIIKTLVESGAQKEVHYRTGFTPLYVSSRNGHVDVVKYLLSRGVDKEACDGDGSTSLYVAAQNGHADCVNVLLQHGANPAAVFLDSYNSVYIAAQNGHHKVLEILCQRGVSVNQVAGNGSVALYVASQNGHVEAVNTLLKYNANTETPFGAGYRSIYIAAQKGHLEIVKLLVRAGANVNVPTFRNATPLYVASQKGFVDLVQFLLENGADMNIPFENGFLPLHIATQECQKEVVKLLLCRPECRIDAKSNHGRIAADLALTDEIKEVFQNHHKQTAVAATVTTTTTPSCTTL